jgi:hypothetical protein
MYNPYPEAMYNPYPEAVPYAYPAPAPVVAPIVIPVPTHTFTYDPYWPSRVTPSNHPLIPISTARFRGEILAGNCLMIYE